VGECFFSYWLTHIVLDKIQRAMKRLCVICLSVCKPAYLLPVPSQVDWPVRKENDEALSRQRWMSDVKVKDRVPSKHLRERLGIDNIISVLKQNRLQWYGHVLQKENNDWVKKCMEYEVDQEVDQRVLGERSCKKSVKHIS